ncbi:MAG: ATP-binding protein, partial [Pirellulales bacterium]
AFRVGLIYGPSGCGKTSFVKAGVMPLLSREIATVYVEATLQDTESRLLKQLRRCCPQLPVDLNLTETMVHLRRDDAVRSHRKVVVIIDQFEQWLHSQSDYEQSELVCALRQCDGVRLQCIIAVRDDFWMAVTRFMELLETALIPDRNVLAVDLFSVRHARKVLTALGRSYGALALKDDDIAAEQKAFVRKAVEDLARTGQVIPVHLALFAEMVKDKPWELRTLRDVGGAEGVGFTFLEETFNGRSANPNHRLHQAAAQAVLQALLSDRGGGIKGRMRSYSELLEASGYQQSPQAFDALLRILDTELRLITPTDPMGLDTQAARDNSVAGRERHYHLTHDYLVPSLES